MSKSVLVVWGGIALLIGFFWVYFPTLSRYRDLKSEEEKYARQLAEIESKIDQLKEERDLLKHDKEYLEKVIREELGLVKPGEIIYKFVQEEPKKEPPASVPAVPPKSEVASKKLPQPILPLPPQEDDTVFDNSQPAYPRQETR